MSEPTPQFATPLPGDKVPKQEASLLTKKFKDKFRKYTESEIPNNVPTACLLMGRKDHAYLDNPRFLKHKNILFYLEAACILHRASPMVIAHYFLIREPWENYDVCLFDESFGWCVGITHNDDVIIAD